MRRKPRRAPGTTPAPPVATEAEAPLPPLARDPWAWVALSVVLLLVARSLGAPFGEPVADDFDHLHHARFSADHSWFGNGGSASFWRPVAYQGYYGLLAGVILRHPAWISALHVALVALAVVLAYGALRRCLPRPAAASAASFPWLVESARALVLVPVHFVDLGLIVFSVVAWRAAVAGRLAASLAALLAALLCKETAVATAAVLPWLARPGAGRGRRPWIAGAAAVVLAWGAAYASVRSREAMALPHGLEAGFSPRLLLDWERYAWAVTGTLRTLLGLPMRGGDHGELVYAAAILVFGLAAVALATSRAARARLAAVRGIALAGLAWSAIASALLVTVFPIWSPQRVVFAALGLGATCAAVLHAAHPALPWALVALRLATFLAAPGAPARVAAEPPETGAFVDFVKLARLQRFVLEARSTLLAEFPALPHGARVALVRPPRHADYAMGDRALQLWYRDTTLHWIRWEQLNLALARDLAGAVEFVESATPQFRRVETEVLRLLFSAEALDLAGRYQEVVDTLARADSLQRDREAHHVLGRIQGFRALRLAMIGRLPEAEALARRSLAIAPENADGRITLAVAHSFRREWPPALAQLDSVDSFHPGHETAARMRRLFLERLRVERGAGVPASPQGP